MARESDIYLLGATQLVIGTSAILHFANAQQFVGSGVLKRMSGGSLEIVSAPPALTGSSAVVWGTGYLLEPTESVAIGGPASFYLAATGATVIAGYIFGKTNGATI